MMMVTEQRDTFSSHEERQSMLIGPISFSKSSPDGVGVLVFST